MNARKPKSLVLDDSQESRPDGSAEHHRGLVRLFALRMLVQAEGYRRFLTPTGYGCGSLADFVGLSDRVPEDRGSYSISSALQALREIHRDAERQMESVGYPPLLVRNIENLARLVGLRDDDIDLLLFIILLQSEQHLDEASDQVGPLSTVQAHRVLTQVTGLSESSIRDALRPESVLNRTGLVSLDNTQSFPLRLKVDLISSGCAEALLSQEAQPLDLLRGRVVRAPVAELDVTAFEHEPSISELLLPYLRQVIAKRRLGSNVLLWGPPGTGKSSIVRAAASAIGAELYEVAFSDDCGQPIDGRSRLRAYRASQRILSDGTTDRLLVFDEMEDLLEADARKSEELGRPAAIPKAYLNRALETNVLPTIWVSNSCSFDPALIRRFDLILEIRGDQRAGRRRLFQDFAKDLVIPGTVEALAESVAVAPAVVSRASEVVRLIGMELPVGRRDSLLRSIVSSTVKAQRFEDYHLQTPRMRIPTSYDLSFLNVDVDIEALIEGLRERRAGRLLLAGPAGTGKSMLAVAVAKALDLGVQCESGSSLLGAYVGQSEAQVRQAFERATKSKDVLVIDECDGFFDRAIAQRSWETTLSNEFLLQLESFDGIFFGSTNRLQVIDDAFLRRADLVIRFDYLRPAQSSALLKAHCGEMGIPAPDLRAIDQVQRLSNLSPGDFGAVRRRAEFSRVETAEQFVAALESMSRIKQNGTGRPVGFTG